MLPQPHRKAPEGVPEFLTAIHGSSSGLFTKDPAFWQTVHCGGDSWQELQQELKTAAKKAWKDKVVVKDVHLHTLGYSTDTPAQVGWCESTNIVTAAMCLS